MECVTVLPAAMDDLPRILALEEQCFSYPHTMEQLCYEMEDNLHDLIVAKKGQAVLGYVGMSHILDEGYISNVAVDGKFRRQGIADALLSALDAASDRYALAFISLEVRESNEPAIRLYEKNGYEKTGRIPGCYSHPKEDALVMTKTYHRERKPS